MEGVLLNTEPQNWVSQPGVARIGRAALPTGSSASWVGALDEVRVSDVARSADWIAAEYASMAGGLVQLGPPEPVEP